MTRIELARQQAVLEGFATVANLHKGVDEALIAWAQETGHYVYIGAWTRQGRLVHPRSPWFNPYGTAHGDQATRVALYADYLDGHPAPATRLPRLSGPELLTRLPELAGQVLGCWCVPEHPCHGLELLKRLQDGSLERYQADSAAGEITPQRGLSRQQQHILLFLWERTQELRQARYWSEYWGVPWHSHGTRSFQASLSRALKRLEQRGLVLRVNGRTGQPDGMVRQRVEQLHTRSDHVRLLPAGIEVAKWLTNEPR